MPGKQARLRLAAIAAKKAAKAPPPKAEPVVEEPVKEEAVAEAIEPDDTCSVCGLIRVGRSYYRDGVKLRLAGKCTDSFRHTWG